ncbi:phosphodiester glycosidase family protein [Anaerobacillus sp. CMMVII]|uniref:phosphodiester glycosidase family protein n=1 Tax=Anaerobacillus sp. CMMVII TaxID=2755588 RepID=UPI0021B73270|nr:phosphodiester glycosidase family protein [Anaerobacillus sp. CMMVII]MCT8140519.1 phosphodiester glycosidase family protein [Anaerobacillus sp. CMMVII]
MPIKIQLFIVFLLAPFFGSLLYFTQHNPYSSFDSTSLLEGYTEIQEQNETLKQNLFEKGELLTEAISVSHVSNELLTYVQNNANEELVEYLMQQEKLNLIVEASVTYQQKSADLSESLLTTMLGEPIDQTFGENSIVKIYSLQEAGYRGFMAKIRLHNPKAIRMVLASDEVASFGETTSQAAARTGAILAINAGGFTNKNGKLQPIGITVIDGQIVTYSKNRFSFIGFNKNGNLVGGNITSRKQIKELEVLQGASFLPTLLKEGKKQPIPKEWAKARHPRTIIGHFHNGDLFFMVVDGRRTGWSTGVTLEEAQEKLLEFNIRDAYNLDGGGSSTFYYNGKVLNKPSEGRERRVTTNIVVIP